MLAYSLAPVNLPTQNQPTPPLGSHPNTGGGQAAVGQSKNATHLPDWFLDAQ